MRQKAIETSKLEKHILQSVDCFFFLRKFGLEHILRNLTELLTLEEEERKEFDISVSSK